MNVRLLACFVLSFWLFSCLSPVACFDEVEATGKGKYLMVLMYAWMTLFEDQPVIHQWTEFLKQFSR